MDTGDGLYIFRFNQTLKRTEEEALGASTTLPKLQSALIYC